MASTRLPMIEPMTLNEIVRAYLADSEFQKARKELDRTECVRSCEC